MTISLGKSKKKLNASPGADRSQSAGEGIYRDENVFEDADIQMAGYAAALRVRTLYAIIDGRDMTAEASSADQGRNYLRG